MPTINPNSTNKRTALTLLNTVLGEIGLNSINSVQSTDDTARQLLFLANGFGSRMAMLPFWADLKETWSVTTIADQTTYDLPTDWGVPVVGTSWDRTGRWPLVGPVPPMQWQVLQSGGFGVAAPRYKFRFSNLQMEVYPAPPVDLNFVHEYLSTGWVLGVSGGSATLRKPRITVDSDYILLPEEMFITGLKAVWLQAKGLRADAPVAEFKSMLEAGWGAVNSAPVLSFVGGEEDGFVSYANVRDTGFGA